MSKLLTLRQIVKYHLPAPPKPMELLPATRASFEEHKASIAARIDSLVAKRADAMKRVKHYGSILSAALRWKATPGEADFVASKREAVLCEIRDELSSAQSDASKAKRNLKLLRSLLSGLTEDSFYAQVSKQNHKLREYQERLFRSDQDRDARMRHEKKCVLASFDASQKPKSRPDV